MTNPLDSTACVTERSPHMLRSVMAQRGRSLLLAAVSMSWVAVTFLLLISCRRDSLALGVGPLLLVLLLRVPRLCEHRVLFLGTALALYGGLLTLEASIRLSTFGFDAIVHPADYSPYGLVDELVEPAADRSMVFQLKPGLDTRFMGRRVQVNEHGCRERDFGVDKPANTRRVLVIGTSITFGAGTSKDATYSAELERLLRATGERVEVLDCGTPGFPTALVFRRVKQLAPLFHPDDVIVEIASSGLHEADDVSAVERAFGTMAVVHPQISAIERFSFALSGIYPPAALRYKLDTLLHRRDAQRTQPPPAVRRGTAFVEAQLGELARLGRALGFSVTLLLPRGLSGFDRPAPEPEARARLADVGHALGVKVVDTSSLFGAGDLADDFIVFPGDLHPNSRAHARFAQALYPALRVKH